MKNLFVAVIALIAVTAVNAQDTKQELRKERAEVRMEQKKAMAASLNKAIQNRNWEFIPDSYQAPYLGTKFVYQDYYVQMYPSYIQVSMPYTTGFPYSGLTYLNFDTSNIHNYQLEQTSNGYNISFYILGQGVTQYTFQLSVDYMMNDATLVISTPMGLQVTYSGSIISYGN